MYHIHLILPNDPLASRPISMPSKNRVSVGSLGSEICTQKQLVSPTTQNQNKQCSNQSPTGGGCCEVLCSCTGAREVGAEEEAGSKPHNTLPLSVIGWNTICFGFEWLVKPIVFVCRSQSLGCLQGCAFLMACLWGGQLADRQERLDECDKKKIWA